MAWWVKVLATMPGELILFLGPTWWKVRTDSQKLSLTSVPALSHTCAHTHIYTKPIVFAMD